VPPCAQRQLGHGVPSSAPPSAQLPIDREDPVFERTIETASPEKLSMPPRNLHAQAFGGQRAIGLQTVYAATGRVSKRFWHYDVCWPRNSLLPVPAA
jgi:hypothetical protein